MHQGVPPSATIRSVSAFSSSMLCGTSYPACAKFSGTYQTKDFTSAL